MYAKFEDIQARCDKVINCEEKCDALLEDAAIIVDAYNKLASADAKKIVSCNMVIRAIGGGEDTQVPVGANQGTMSALTYSQSWSYTNGASGELYLSKLDKKLLGFGRNIRFVNPLEGSAKE